MSAYIVENQSIKPNFNKSSQFKHNSMLPHTYIDCLHSRTKLGQSYFHYCLKKMNDILLLFFPDWQYTVRELSQITFAFFGIF